MNEILTDKNETTRVLICITCPRGCPMTVHLRDGKFVSVEGNTCTRGAAYAEAECTHPVRTLTSTVQTVGGKVLPVKTNRPIPKELLLDAMKAVNGVKAPDDAKIGDVLIPNILGTDADLVATANA